MRRQLARTLLPGISLLLLLSLILSLPRHGEVEPNPPTSNAPSKVTAPQSEREVRMRVSEAYGKLPLSFEENRGQANRQVKFLSRGQNYALMLTPAEAVLSLRTENKTQTQTPATQSALLRMKLLGANPSPKIAGRDQLPGRSNYLIGDQSRWHTNIPNYERVQYDQVYPGIDLVYYGNQRRLEYDFVVAPGADANVIRLNFAGAEAVSLAADGSLRLQLKGGEVTQPAPVIYQKNEGNERQPVAGGYVLNGDEITFQIADYDRSRELVIDPQLLYATFYGGSGDDRGEDIAVDGSGNAYITGFTKSPNLQLLNAEDGNLSGTSDAFVLKLNPTGSNVIYATYLGGSGSETADAIAITGDGRACVTGSTGSETIINDFPTTPGRFQGGVGGGSHVFVTVLAPNGSSLVYSTFFRGFQGEGADGIAVDAANNVYITGNTFSRDLPTKNAFQRNMAGIGLGRDAFVAKFNPALSGNSSLVYSSYLGGTGGDIAGDFGNDIAVTPGGVAFVVGETDATNFPVKSPTSLSPLQSINGGGNDAFIAKVSPSGDLIYATLFGGNDNDSALGVAVDSDERAYVTGFTASSAATFPLKNAFQPNRIGSAQDGFVAKFNADGTALFYSSFLGGGTISNLGIGIAIDGDGSAYIAGQAVIFNEALAVNGFPASVPNNGGMIAKIGPSDASGTTVPKLLYLDGFGTVGNAIDLDARGNVYVCGTNVGSMPTTAGVIQPTSNGGSNDATVAKITPTFPDTIGTFRPSANPRALDFFLRNSNTAGPSNLSVDFGQLGDQPLSGDWNGDGVDDVGVYRPATAQFLLRQPTRLPIGTIIEVTLTINFGLPGDKAVVGDWDGNGTDTPGVLRNGQFFLTNGPNISGSSPPAEITFSFGGLGDTPVAGDWNGDGIDTVGTFFFGNWSLRNSNSAGAADITVPALGPPESLPVVGDWNGDGVDTIGLLLPSSFLGAPTFGLINVNAAAPFDVLATFGANGDFPISGDWDGKVGNTPPDSGVNNPSEGSNRVGETQVFTTTCSDPDGWHDLSSIDFKIATSRAADRDKGDHDDHGRSKDDWRDREDARSEPDREDPRAVLWVRFDENKNVVQLYDPDLRVWQEGTAGSNIVLETRYARLLLSGTAVQGSGPLGPSVQITWTVQFKPAAKGGFKQFLKITDDVGSSTGFDRVGNWKVKP